MTKHESASEIAKDIVVGKDGKPGLAYEAAEEPKDWQVTAALDAQVSQINAGNIKQVSADMKADELNYDHGKEVRPTLKLAITPLVYNRINNALNALSDEDGSTPDAPSSDLVLDITVKGKGTYVATAKGFEQPGTKLDPIRDAEELWDDIF